MAIRLDAARRNVWETKERIAHRLDVLAGVAARQDQASLILGLILLESHRTVLQVQEDYLRALEED